MLCELRVENLGIVEELTLEFGSGMTAITGETGAGKTLLMTALGLLVGGRATPDMVRDGADEARVDGRFFYRGEEIILTRVVSAEARSRAYQDGRPVTAGQLGEIGAELLDLHGQHAHQSLLDVAAQRVTLDHYAGDGALACLDELRSFRDERAMLDDEMVGAGGDPRTRARELDLLAFQIEEIERAAIESYDEDDRLAEEEDLLAEADAHRDALESARSTLEGTAADAIGSAVAAVAGRSPFVAFDERLRAVQAELADLATDIRHRLDDVRVDPQRLEEVRRRRETLRELRRKYGADLAEVVEFAETAKSRVAELVSHDDRVASLEARRIELDRQRMATAERLRKLRTEAAGPFAAAVTGHLRELAMASAELVVVVQEGPLTDTGADVVRFLLAPNEGESAKPLDKAASGGELSRTMLAIRVVLSEAPPVLVFDEVDAGIGGEAGTAVGRSLAKLADGHQVLVVTHLAQVAACADSQVAIAKATTKGRTRAKARTVIGADRIDELSRMLAGAKSSDSSRRYATELLESDR